MVLATVQGSVLGGPYLLECNEEKRLPCVVAWALVQPKARRVPIQLLNFKSEYVTILSRVELATLESTEPPPEEVVASVPTQPANLDPNKVELLENIVAKNAELVMRKRVVLCAISPAC